MRKLIKVKRKHINKGFTLNTNSCPIALAVRETLDIKRINVRCTCLYFHSKWISLSCSAVRFIEKFDSRGRSAVKPFNFYLNY